jgi:poly-beta-hydroxyalkanoate depolymerase
MQAGVGHYGVFAASAGSIRSIPIIRNVILASD